MFVRLCKEWLSVASSSLVVNFKSLVNLLKILSQQTILKYEGRLKGSQVRPNFGGP